MSVHNCVRGAVFGIAVVLASIVAAQQRAERLTDKDVKALFDSVNDARDRFEDQLDGKVKNGVVRSARGETKVSAALDDLQEEMGQLKSRFTDSYAASSEAEAVLRQGSWFATMMASQPRDLRGMSEWERLRVELTKLADAYAAAFPLPDGAAVRRINDAEAAATAGAIVKQAELLKRAAGSDRTLAKADKQALEKDVEEVIKQAKALQSRLNDGKPASAEARLLKEKVAALTPGGRQLPPAVLSAIGPLRAPLDKLDQAFGVGAR
jgi:hypothetical protein